MANPAGMSLCMSATGQTLWRLRRIARLESVTTDDLP